MENNIIWEELPAEVVLFNPEKKLKGGGSDVVDYPVSEEAVDGNGDSIIDRQTGLKKMTGESFLWSINAGERVKFPKYVAKILKERYGFLRIELSSKQEVKKAITEKFDQPICPYDDIPFGTEGALEKHIAEKHPDEA